MKRSRKAPARTYFEDVVLKYEGNDCLIWPFSRDEFGYGTLSYEGRKSNVSNHVCRKVHGEPPSPKHEAAHSCGNGCGGCVNPKHLFWATHNDNMKDRRTRPERKYRSPAAELRPISNRRIGRLNLVGQKFGRLTVIGLAGKDAWDKTVWHCQCDCGNRILGRPSDMKRGRTQSCGCLTSELTATKNTTHGLSKHPLYKLWAEMMKRCRKNLYAGIKVAERWHDFRNFVEDVGDRPSKQHSLDRYPDKDGDYGPGNFRWATPTEQVRNRHNTALINGRPLQDIAEELQLNPGTLKSRLRYGMAGEQLLFPGKYKSGPKTKTA